MMSGGPAMAEGGCGFSGMFQGMFPSALHGLWTLAAISAALYLAVHVLRAARRPPARA